MATFKALIIPSNKRQDGTWNVKIRVTHHRKVRYLSTPFYVSQKQITRSYKIKDALLNDKLDEELSRLRLCVYEIGFAAEAMNVDGLIYHIKSKREEVSFTDYAKTKIDIIERDKMQALTAAAYRTALKSIIDFNNGDDIKFSLFSKKFVSDYYLWMLGRVSEKTAQKYIAVIKHLYNMACAELNDEDNGIIIVKYGCFDAIEIHKPSSENVRAFVDVSEMQAVIDVPYSGNILQDFAKDMFVFSFVCLGINIADIIRLEKSCYSDGIITYRRKKIERRAGNKSEIMIKVPEVARIIIDKYSSDKDYLIAFPNRKRIEYCARYIHDTFRRAGLESTNKRSDKGKSNYVFYSARHSMATFARNICGIDKATVHEMLNHASSKEFAMTDVYLRRDYSHLWEANDKLLSLFDWSFYLNQRKMYYES